MKKLIAWLKGFFIKKEKVSVDELYKELQQYNKNQLVKELIVQAQINNKNQCGIDLGFKKDIKKNYSKKQIIKAIILLRISGNKKIKKIVNKLARADKN